MDVILDNIGFSLQKIGGLSMVWKALIDSLVKSDLSYKCLEYPGALANKVRKDMESYIVEERKPLSMLLERYRNPHINNDTPFVFHSSHYRTTNNPNAFNITTVHDFTYELYSQGFARKVHSWQKYNAIRRADVIVSISENTKKDILHFLPEVDPQKIRVIHNGVSNDYKPVVNSKYKDMSGFVAFIGIRRSYKNFLFVVESIKDTSFSLAIVGSPLNEEEVKFLDSQLGRNRYKYMGFLSNDDLNELYNACFCLAYPSAYEGFGIPVLEAQRAGCPVIAYNSSSIPEIIGETPLLLKEINIHEFQNKLNLLKDDMLRESIIKNGYENSKRFSWDKMGGEYVELYKELLNK